MKRTTGCAKAFFSLALTAAVGFVATASRGGGGGLDDAVLLLQGDMDVNGDGLVTQDEARNALNRNAAPGDVIDLKVRGSFDGTNGGISNPVARVALPRRGRTVSSRVLRFKTQMTQYADGRDAAWASGLTLAKDFPMSEKMEMSAVVRFRWDGFVSRADGTQLSSQACLVSYGHKDNGISCWISRPHPDGTPRLEFSNWHLNQVVSGNDFVIKTNVWYDLAYTVTKDRLHVYLFPEGHRDYAKISHTSFRVTVFSGEAFATDERVFGVGMGLAYSAGNDFYYPMEKWDSEDMEGYQNGFNGDIHALAVWNRILSAEEVEEAFMGGGAADCQIGVANGTNAEFAAASAASDVWSETDGWLRFKGELTQVGARAAWRLANREPHAHARLCQVALCAPTGRGRLGLAVNGTSLGEKDVEGTGSLVFDIPADAVRPGETNDFALTLLAGGPVTIDALTIGGGFSIQARGSAVDNKGHLLDEDPLNFSTYLTSRAGHAFGHQLVYRFSLPRLFAARRMRWTVTRQSDHGADAAGYAAFVNGTCVHASQSLMPASWKFLVPRGTLHEGLNTLVISNATSIVGGDSAYYTLDSLTGEPLPDRGGLLVIR